MEVVIQQAKNAGVSVAIGAAGIGVQLANLEIGIKVAIGVVTLGILGVRAAIAVLDLRKRIRDERCLESSSNRPPTV